VASTPARVDRAGRQRLPIETRVNGGNMIVEAALGLAQRVTPTLRRGELRRQLVAAVLAELLVLGGVDLGGLRQDLPGDLLVVEVGVLGGIPWLLVPSMASTSIPTNPASAQRPRTCRPTRS
jgi:hypothetical protein